VHRACHSCRKRKQGCDEQRPCKRCTEKGIECLEVEGKKRRSDKGSDEEFYSDEEIVGTPEVDCDSCSEDEHSGIEALDSDNAEPTEERKSTRRQLMSPRRRNLSTSSTSSLASLLSLDAMPGTPPSGQDSDSEEIKPRQKSHLALLLPFLSSHMEAPCSESSSSSSEDEEEQETNILSRTLRGEDFPFSGIANCTERINKEEMDVNYREMWLNFLGLAKEDGSYHMEFQKIKSLWTEIMRCIRSLEWHKLHHYLDEMEDQIANGPAVVFWSSGGRIQYANSSFLRLVGFSNEELRSCDTRRSFSAHTLFHPEDSVRISQKQLETLESPEEQGYYQTRTRLLTKLRREVPVSASISNVRDSFGMPLLTVAHFSALPQMP